MRVVASFSMLWAVIHAYPRGPPTTVCGSMTPRHEGTAAQTNSAPYSLTFKSDSNCYAAGQTYEVTLSSSQNLSFVGFLIEARKPKNETYSFGTFSANNDPYMQTLSCFGISASAIAHSNPNVVNWPSKTFKWTAPNGTIENLEFVATVVQAFSTYWVKMNTNLPCCGCQNSSTVSTTTTKEILMSTISSSIGVASSPPLFSSLDSATTTNEILMSTISSSRGVTSSPPLFSLLVFGSCILMAVDRP